MGDEKLRKKHIYIHTQCIKMFFQNIKITQGNFHFFEGGNKIYCSKDFLNIFFKASRSRSPYNSNDCSDGFLQMDFTIKKG